MYEISFFKIGGVQARQGKKVFASLPDAAVWWLANAELLPSFARGRSILTDLNTGNELHYIADREKFQGTLVGNLIATEGRDIFSCFNTLVRIGCNQ